MKKHPLLSQLSLRHPENHDGIMYGHGNKATGETLTWEGGRVWISIELMLCCGSLIALVVSTCLGRQSCIMPFLVCIYIYNYVCYYIRIATALLAAALTLLFWILGQTLLVSTICTHALFKDRDAVRLRFVFSNAYVMWQPQSDHVALINHSGGGAHSNAEVGKESLLEKSQTRRNWGEYS